MNVSTFKEIAIVDEFIENLVFVKGFTVFGPSPFCGIPGEIAKSKIN